MISTPAPCASARRQAGGFTLIELMVGLMVGLLATLLIAEVLKLAEGQRRSSTSGSDAQVNGGLAIYAMQRQLKMAGYGIATQPAGVGCTLSGQFGGTTLTTLPAVLAPVLITVGASGAPDSIRMLSSSKASFSLPSELTSPFYDPTDMVGDKAVRIPLTSSLGMEQGDLLALVYQDAVPPAPARVCQLLQVSEVPALKQVERKNVGSWNTAGFPDAKAANGAFMLNLGALNDVTFALTSDYKLRQTNRRWVDQSSNFVDLQPNIVALRAFYGKDTDGDGVVDTYNTTLPANNAEWLQVLSVRVAVLARSTQFERDEVTTTGPSWDFGSTSTVEGSAACRGGANRCITMKADVTSDWKHYRYKLFEVMVPLRNQLWKG